MLTKLYYKLRKIIDENSSWRNKFIDELAVELKISFSNIKGFIENQYKLTVGNEDYFIDILFIIQNF